MFCSRSNNIIHNEKKMKVWWRERENYGFYIIYNLAYSFIINIFHYFTHTILHLIQ